MKDIDEEAVPSVEFNFDNIISAAAYSVRYITKLGQISFEETTMRELTVQPSKATTDYKKTIVVREPSMMECRFRDLPVNLQLLIFSYLDARTLCKIAPTCKYWKMLSEDKVLWAQRLSTDLKKWKCIGHMTYPPTYLETNTDLTTKEIYLRCCPSCQSLWQPKTNAMSSFASVFLNNLQNIPNLFTKKPLKVVMFGPGLESETKSLTQTILWGTKSPFQVTGLFAGEFEGVGSGVCLKLKKSKVELNLITLYGSTSAERERNAREGKERVSKLLAEKDNQDDDNHDDNAQPSAQVEVSHSVKELCKTVDAFIYVVNSSTEIRRVDSENQELNAVMNVNWSRPRVPLLVLSCVATKESQSLSCAQVVELLNMTQLNRPWQVNSVCVENLDGFLDGVSWLVKQAT
ncbi:F-box only protein 4-like [Actinia tenebrosa]|uniref:F-box only protein 4-like n=1 Tax=Actinia tenebrosa TaxID=6105 RepID=A0A6P8I7U5_ACTTE|nr:F-box only protein 4-like [Actinia tenebrosa]